MKIEQCDDRELVERILTNDKEAIKYFFFEKCSNILSYVSWSVFEGKINKQELLNEIYLHLAKDSWHKLRQFDFRSKLTTWFGVVAVRFFQKKRSSLIENDSTMGLLSYNAEHSHSPQEIWSSEYDLHKAINKMPNERYRKVIELMDLEGYLPEETAKMLNVSVANLYNIRRRAHVQLSFIIKGSKL